MSSNRRGFEWCKKHSHSLRSGKCDAQHATAAQYFTLQKQDSTFTLGLNTAKNTPCIKKCFKQKLSSIKFATKNSVGAYVYLPQEWS